MLGNCILRNPTTFDSKFDSGSLCESLLFFDKVHIAIDLATLGAMIDANFIDHLISFLDAKLLTANYSPQAPVLHTHTQNGIKEHFFTIIKIVGDQKKSNKRNPELLEDQMLRRAPDKTLAKKQFRKLADLISFKDVDDNGLPQLARNDVRDPYIAKEVARLALIARGIPESEIKFTYVDVAPLDEFKFALATDIDFDRLRKFVPEGDRTTFGQQNVITSIGDARFDIGLAASQNAAFVGNERNEVITNMILKKSLGVGFGHQQASRQIYDFISVAVPGIREVINHGERTPQEFLALIDKATAFKGWLRQQNPTADLVAEMLRDKASSDWL